MTNTPNGATAWHRKLDEAVALRAEEDAQAAAFRERQLENGTIPAASGGPCAWLRTINNLAERAKEVAAEEAETSRKYYDRVRRDVGGAA